MKDLTSSDLVAKKGDKDRGNIENIRGTLSSKISSPQEHSTAKYVLDLFDVIIQANTDINNFAYSKNIALFFPNNLAKMNQMIKDTVESKLLCIDLDQITINDEDSCSAAQAVSELLEIHYKTFEEPQILAKKTQITDKITAYNQEKNKSAEPRPLGSGNVHANPCCSTSFNEAMVTTEDCNTGFEGTTPLTDHYTDIAPHTELVGSLDKTLVNNNQCTTILNQFDALSAVFCKKITELEDRCNRVSKDKQKAYIPAINDAKALLTELKKIRDTYQLNQDLALFTQATTALFETFQNKDSFKTNRSTPWFRVLVSQPFEQIKAFINLISECLFRTIYGQPSEPRQYKGTLFSPSKTDTTKKLNEFIDGVERLCHTP